MTDYDDLEKRLRARGCEEGVVVRMDGDISTVIGKARFNCTDSLCIEAADAIAALVKERDELQDTLDTLESYAEDRRLD